jgi:hypothetical protein
VVRIEMLDKNERHVVARRQRIDKLSAGIQTACRRAYPDHKEVCRLAWRTAGRQTSPSRSGSSGVGLTGKAFRHCSLPWQGCLPHGRQNFMLHGFARGRGAPGPPLRTGGCLRALGRAERHLDLRCLGAFNPVLIPVRHRTVFHRKRVQTIFACRETLGARVSLQPRTTSSFE